MKKLQHLLEFSLVLALDAFFRVLPARTAFWLGEQVGRMVSFLIPKRQKLILENLKNSFPEKSDEERIRISRAVWRNLGRIAVEFIRLPSFLKNRIQEKVICEGMEHLENARRENRGAIILTAHFTNWELTGVLTQLRCPNLLSIARPMKNLFVERWVQSKRSAAGMQIILHRQAVKASLKWLKEKKVMGILVDQNLYHGGVFVDFFGRPAATTTLPALLHLRTGAPVIQVYLIREKDSYRLVYEPPMQFPDVPDEAERVRVITQVINNHLEQVVRRYPENWFWIHNRWKRKPESTDVPVDAESEE